MIHKKEEGIRMTPVQEGSYDPWERLRAAYRRDSSIEEIGTQDDIQRGKCLLHMGVE